MSSPDPSIVQELAKEADAQEFEEAGVHSAERVDIDDPTVSSSGSKEFSDSEPTSSHRRRLRTVRSMEKRLRKKESLKWHELVGSYLDHSKGDLIRERLGMPTGNDLAMHSAEDRATFLPLVIIPSIPTR